MTKFLSVEYLNVPKEETVFEAAMLWINKCPTRRQHLEKVSHFSMFHLIFYNVQMTHQLHTQWHEALNLWRCVCRIPEPILRPVESPVGH